MRQFYTVFVFKVERVHRRHKVEITGGAQLNIRHVECDERSAIGSRLFVVKAERVRDLVRRNAKLKKTK
jgi:hypothetical protein